MYVPTKKNIPADMLHLEKFEHRDSENIIECCMSASGNWISDLDKYVIEIISKDPFPAFRSFELL